MTLNTQISELHEQALVIDSHNDAIVAHIRRGNVSLADENAQNTTDPVGTIAYLRGPVPLKRKLSASNSTYRKCGREVLMPPFSLLT